MKRIGINAVYLNPDRSGGTETYVRDLLGALQRLELRERLIVFAGKGHRLKLEHPNFEIVECDVNPRRQYHRALWEQLHLPKVLGSHRLDLVHFPYSASAVRYRGRSVIGLQDSVRFVAPHSVPLAYRIYRSAIERQIVRRKQHVIAVSHADAEVLRQHLGIPDEQISVVYHSVPEQFVLPDGNAPPKGDYILWAGRPYPHKNVDLLIAAYGLLKQRRRDLPKLRLIGVERSYHPRLLAVAREQGLESLVSVETPIPHRDVPEVFRRALLLVFPSRYEGFGLPGLEAMASGTAVVCSDIPAFKELYGSAAWLCDVNSPGAFAEAIDCLLTDESRRAQFVERGRKLAARFKPDGCARATLEVYRRLLQ